ncbi:hypothetical protein [Synechococcus sp. CBW1004]|uniref:hypothetical protein n=1 Tax=Synechococcus sp. CBW1004 TaxID=1353136 RepID=UPI001E5D2902|nr:hypothetical protein [Synechococcus sp. CBW1004]
MTSNQQILIPWSPIIETWINEDPYASDNFWSYYPDANHSPYEQLIQIHMVAEDTNADFFDSLVHVISNIVNDDSGGFQCDFCEEGVYVIS